MVFYEHWFSVAEEAQEKLLEKAKEFTIFCKNCSNLSKENAREYKRMIVAKVEAQCQGSYNFFDNFFGDLFSQILYPYSSKNFEQTTTEIAVEKFLKQGFDQM